MPMYVVIKPYKFAYGGHKIRQREKGDELPDTDESVPEMLKAGYLRKKGRAAKKAAADA